MDIGTISDILLDLGVFLIPIVAGYAARYWAQNRQYINDRIEAEIGEKQWALAREIAETLINAAEQITGIDTNEEKKAFVVGNLHKWAARVGIPLDEQDVEAIVEGVYAEWKRWNRQVK